MKTTIQSLTRFPVKGLSGQSLNSVSLETGQGFPSDRRFGFARPGSGFDPANPKPLPKTKFYMLACDEALAVLQTHYDENSGVLSMTGLDNSGQFDLGTTDGKSDASNFLKHYLALPDDEMPQLYEASPHRFTDVSVDSEAMMNAVSIINVDSVAAFSKKIEHAVDPGRFRGNIHLTKLPAFAELDMVGQHMIVGTARLKIVARTRRCPATEVNLETGERDIKTPRLLRAQYGHMDMGVYAQVVDGGSIAPGDEVEFV